MAAVSNLKLVVAGNDPTGPINIAFEHQGDPVMILFWEGF